MSTVESREASKKSRNYHEASDEDIDNLMESDNGHMSTDDTSDPDQSSNCASSVEDVYVEDDKKTNKRIYSKTRIPFKAWNEQADQIMNMIKDGTRLVDITANYLPDAWNYEGQDFSQDFWYVTSVDPFVRNEPAEVQGELNA